MDDINDNHTHDPAAILRRLLTEADACPTTAEAGALAEAYPYMSLPAVLRLRNAPRGEITDSERDELVMRVAAGAPGRDTLFRLLDSDGERIAAMNRPADAPETASDTDRAIDTFLATYGRMSPREEALLEKMIFNPVPDDYAALLEREAQQGSGSEHSEHSEHSENSEHSEYSENSENSENSEYSESSQSSQFSQSSQPPSNARAAKPARPVAAAPDSGSSLSESLAQVYIRRGRYDKAYDIIHALSLNNPKKSVYFADQLRFLQKLMLIERASRGDADGLNNV